MSDERERLIEAVRRADFTPGLGAGAVDNLVTATLAALRREIDWYRRRADARRLGSQAVRAGALILSVTAALLVQASALPQSGLEARVDVWLDPLGLTPAFLALAALILAGALVAADRLGHVTAGFTRFRLAEYRLRRGEAKFLAGVSAALAAAGRPDRATFDRLKALAFAAIDESYAVVTAETEEHGEMTRGALADLVSSLAAQQTASLTRVEAAATAATAAASAAATGGVSVTLSEAFGGAAVTLRALGGDAYETRDVPAGGSVLMAAPAGLYALEAARDGRPIVQAPITLVAGAFAAHAF